MSTIKKKRYKLKKKNCIIALLILFLTIFLIHKTISFVGEKKEQLVQQRIREEELEKERIKKEQKKKEEEKLKSLEQEKIDKFKNLNVDYYNNDYLERYISYQEKNPSIEPIQVIKNVNMHLDYNYYENISPAKNLNTEKILVNKHYYLDENYVPENLETISTRYALSNMKMVNYAKEAFEKLSKDAAKENLKIIAMSTYRSYSYQVNLWNKYAKQDGKEKADTYSGRAGHSEHQTGLAVDVYNEKENYTNFENTKEFIWMQEHAHEYGFILRFPKDKEKETGYQYESWHYRYVGIENATYIKENNISFEEFYATKIKDW